MTETQWAAFRGARERYRRETAEIAAALPDLRSAQQALVDRREGGSFPVDTPVVFNGALDDIKPEDDIKIILVADNPGRREQAAENRRYLVGPSGKLADGFFRAHPELGIDFRKNVVILNKTPIHTPRTTELKELGRIGGAELLEAVNRSQRTMAECILDFHRALTPAALWIIGYSEMAKGKIFESFTLALEELYAPGNPLRERVLLFRHFSMNQFSVDIRRRSLPGEPVADTLYRVGSDYRKRILGW